MQPSKRSKRKRNPETDIVAICLRLARSHAAVAWCQRLNSLGGNLWSATAADHKGHFVRAGWEGAPDLIGQLRGHKLRPVNMVGQMLLVECKRPGEMPTDAQRTFLMHAGDHGALAFVARDPLDVLAVLNAHQAGIVESGYLIDLRPLRKMLSTQTAESILTADARCT